MCVSMCRAKLTETIGMVYLADHPDLGEIFVVGYQNKVQNLHPGANVMILHFPSKEPMTQQNFLDTSQAPHILDDMAEAIRPRTRGEYLGKGLSLGGHVEVFNHDIYTVVLTDNPRLLSGVLRSGIVPEDRMAELSEEMLNWYFYNKQGKSFAFCFFNNNDAKKASPFLVWYKPENLGYFEFPGLDAHTGDVPDLDEMVDVDHTIILGSYRMWGGVAVEYRDNIPDYLKPFLPERVIGKTYSGKLKNGDFRYGIRDIERDHSMNRLYRE